MIDKIAIGIPHVTIKENPIHIKTINGPKGIMNNTNKIALIVCGINSYKNKDPSAVKEIMYDAIISVKSISLIKE